jgi:hypothetical protein
VTKRKNSRMWARKFLGLRRASLVSIVLIWSVSVLYSKRSFEIKVGMGIPPFLLLLGIERQGSIIDYKNGVNLNFNILNWQFELKNNIEISLRNSYYRMISEAIFDFSPQIGLCFYNKAQGVIEVALSAGPFLGGVGTYEYSKGVGDMRIRGSFGGICFKPTLRMEDEQIIIECHFKIRHPLLWEQLLWNTKKWYYPIPIFDFRISSGLKIKGRVYKIGIQIIGGAMACEWLEFILFGKARF